MGALGWMDEACGAGHHPNPFLPRLLRDRGEGGARALQNNLHLRSRAPRYCSSDRIGSDQIGSDRSEASWLGAQLCLTHHVLFFWLARTIIVAVRLTSLQLQSSARCRLSKCEFFANYWPITVLGWANWADIGWG